MRFTRRLPAAAAFGAALVATHLVPTPPPAVANVNQQAMIEDDPHLDAQPFQTLRTFRLLGATVVRVFVPWSKIAPDPNSTKAPRNFNGSNPASYPAANWVTWDNIDLAAKEYGITVDLMPAGGSPRWVDGSGVPSAVKNNPNRAWNPSASAYGAFMRALGTRYSGRYVPKGFSTPLPARPLLVDLERAKLRRGPRATGDRRLASFVRTRDVSRLGERRLECAPGNRPWP